MNDLNKYSITSVNGTTLKAPPGRPKLNIIFPQQGEFNVDTVTSLNPGMTFRSVAINISNRVRRGELFRHERGKYSVNHHPIKNQYTEPSGRPVNLSIIPTGSTFTTREVNLLNRDKSSKTVQAHLRFLCSHGMINRISRGVYTNIRYKPDISLPGSIKHKTMFNKIMMSIERTLQRLGI